MATMRRTIDDPESAARRGPMTALSRAAVDNHKHAHIDAGDTVVLVRGSFPATRRAFSLIDHLYRREATSSTTRLNG